MAWILLEGLDRSGKSSVADYYEGQGYKVIHMEAPNKKYFKEDYSGESYLEEIVRIYSENDGKDVVFDRTTYGELVWPNIFGRLPLLNEEDLDYLSMMERNNEVSKILMFDADQDAHWKRCVDNKEPLNRQQFGRAGIFYERLANEYGFIKKELPDFPEIGVSRTPPNESQGAGDISRSVGSSSGHAGDNDSPGSSNKDSQVGDGTSDTVGNVQTASSVLGDTSESIEQKLARANAIRSLLSGTIIKKKGEVYDNLDASIREFLQQELDSIFTKRLESEIFSDAEINILKSMAQRIQEKM